MPFPVTSVLIFSFKNNFMYLFMAALGLHCFSWAFSYGRVGLLLVVMHRLL